jgi:2-keto-4-pentenoate hydratase/2-oxohepta-3-ene-1,7-dioic acid hydratase in catechol pathway
VNGEVKQDSRTSLLIHDIAALVSYVTAVMTMLPGDVLLTGTPAGVGPLVAGDSVSVSVEGIGVLTNRVVDGT